LSAARTTFGNLTSFADQLAPTATALVPVVKHLPSTLKDSRTLIQTAALLPVSKVGAFERVITPLATQLTQAGHSLSIDAPELATNFKALEYVTNELAYDPGGGNPGFLYWLAWFAHNADSFVGNTDANGPTWRTLIMTSCESLSALSPTLRTLLEALGGNFGC
jgi:phospholipid/cholesterol/gamma-HCH transport system substrate-binding protein